MITLLPLFFFHFLSCQRNVYSCTPSATTASGYKAPSTICSGALIYEHHFDNLDGWRKEETLSGGGNWEFQWYTGDNRNSYVKNGLLYIRPSFTSDIIGNNGLYSKLVDLGSSCTDDRFWGCRRQGTSDNIINPIRSAKLTTINSFRFKYGKLQVRAKLPTGDWLWPAIWMLPHDNAYGGWPTSGEIDVMESRGNKNLYANGKNIGVEQVAETLHWGTKPSNNRWSMTHFEKNDRNGYDNQFKNYELLWTPNFIEFSIDGQVIGKVDPGSSFWNYGNFGNENNPWGNSKMAPFDKEFYIILNLAVGGTNGYFPDTASNPRPKPWSNQSPTAMKQFWEGRGNWEPTWNLGNEDYASLKVDYVKVWAI